MTVLKYEKYILTESNPNEPELDFMRTRILYSGGDIIPGMLHLNCVWYWKGSDTITTKPHTHECDEILAYIGTNPDDPHDLCGEVEVWLEDEKYMLTKSSLIYVPKGLVHCPIYIRKAARPIFHFTAKTQGQHRLVDL
jgi:hypothetical protein